MTAMQFLSNGKPWCHEELPGEALGWNRDGGSRWRVWKCGQEPSLWFVSVGRERPGKVSSLGLVLLNNFS